MGRRFQGLSLAVLVLCVAGGANGCKAGKASSADLRSAHAPPAPARDPVRTEVATGEVVRVAAGDLSVFVPSELAVRDGAYDVMVHFHGEGRLQEKNVAQAHLRAVVVTANEGMGTAPYARAFAADGALDRALASAEKGVQKRGGNLKVGRIALSAWSAGGASVREILAHDSDAARVDAVFLADGLFSSYEEGKKVATAPLTPIVQFARRALEGKALFVLTHTAIETQGYPNVAECTEALFGELGLERPQATVYVFDRSGFHVAGFDGKGPEDHVARLEALDQAYAKLRDRWGHGAVGGAE